MQVYDLSAQFLPKEWIMEKWEEGYYITAMAGSTGGSSLVVMSKGTPYTQQSYKARFCRNAILSMQVLSPFHPPANVSHPAQFEHLNGMLKRSSLFLGAGTRTKHV